MLRTKKQSKSHGNIKSVLSVVLSLVFVGAALLLWMNRQYISDWVAFMQYQPTSEVAAITERTSLSDSGTFYFYASKPVIQNATAFNASCDRKESGSAILGCYAADRIYIYDITNEQLDGIKEVTSAHEMLHAVYQRLSDSEKQRINGLLEKEYQKIKNDEQLAKRMEFYAKNEAGQEYNELHSIVATEFQPISDELEQYYAKYFKDRSSVVKLHDKYAQVFADLQKKSETLLGQLKTLGRSIEVESQQYNVAVKQLNADIQSFNDRAMAGGFTSQAAFVSGRSQLVARASNLDAKRTEINTNVAEYEKMRQEYNTTAASSNELYKSMDSKLAPTPSV